MDCVGVQSSGARTHTNGSLLCLSTQNDFSNYSILHTKPTVTDAESSRELVIKGGNVNFEKVCFAYDERRPLLGGISSVAEAGKTLAFVGKTGSGKSTILNLLHRYYDIKDGSITIDDQDIHGVTLSSLRANIGIVPQKPEMFHRSILENIRYARLNAKDEEIYEVCMAAAIHDRITTFPDGYNTKVGERGVRLSGGELQRIAIARVLLRSPKIVILDEATSAVDTATEAVIQESIEKLSSGRTTIVVAHRLSTIVRAHNIIVLDDGKIVEQGTHAELIIKKGKYAELWKQQTAIAKQDEGAADTSCDAVPARLAV
ncbi:P-loop containing nucleoside triphosphate hydrolase protein [Lophiotrema nucula]|uniref:P-loop containing nucleoside triphosphate hydrolase protein n=1 Tax=Lophiotrema nucula TaxID=690887 RepID=A0A6A5Z450_9PLEO|nr:P-loop containing nucleoside triphosphate hydrolase protein [Lophiotrema nucula]